MTSTSPSRWQPHLAAVLAAGPGAVLSHNSAAALHGLPFARDVPVEISVGRTGNANVSSGTTVHRLANLPPEDICTKRGFKVTAACRTLLDLTYRLGPTVTEKALDEGLIARRWAIADLQACLDRAPNNIKGRSVLNHLVSLRSDTPSADSILEANAFRALHQAAVTHGPYEPHHQVVLGGQVFVLDAAWPKRKVAVEIDGRAHRVASRSVFDWERRKLNVLGVHGWRVVHLTAAMPPTEMLASVNALLQSASD